MLSSLPYQRAQPPADFQMASRRAIVYYIVVLPPAQFVEDSGYLLRLAGTGSVR